MMLSTTSLLSRTLNILPASFRAGFLLLFWLTANTGFAQTPQLKMSDFVLFSGDGAPGATVPTSPGYAVQIGSSATISGGSVGSFNLVTTTGTASFTSNIYSRGTIALTNSNSTTGNIAANGSSGTVISIGSNAYVKGNISANGGIIIGGGTVDGSVTGTTYSGPNPTGGYSSGTPTLPVFPVLPNITIFPPHGQGSDITNPAAPITPGAYNSIKLTGNKTLTLRGPGIYVFNSIANRKNNQIIFDFENKTEGVFLIYVHNNADLAKLSVSIINGGDASRIFTEVHGLGTGGSKAAFQIANGSPNSSNSKWVGTVWAPYAAIDIGSGTGGSEIDGALWSGTQVNIQSGVSIIHVPFVGCEAPVLSVVDANVCSTDQGGNTAIINLNDYASFTGVGTASFSANGPIANPDAYLATNGDVVTYTVENTPACTSSATFAITVNDKQSFGICAPGQGKTFGLIGSELTSLYEIFIAGGEPASSEVFLIQGENVLIEVNYLPNKLTELLPILTSLGFVNQVPEDEASMTIAGFFPIINLLAIDELVTTVNQARPAFPPVRLVGTTTTQGDRALRSDLVRLGYDLTGEGAKVCILSDSYNTLLAAGGDVTSGDLPGVGNPFGHEKPVQLLQEYPWGTGSDEGRAMAQIVHDVAPEAELVFRTAFITAGDFAAGIRQSQAAGCNIIVDDVTYYTEEYYEDGKVARAVNEVTALGASYFTAAGNFGYKSFEGIFTPMTINGLEAHDYRKW